MDQVGIFRRIADVLRSAQRAAIEVENAPEKRKRLIRLALKGLRLLILALKLLTLIRELFRMLARSFQSSAKS